MIIYFINTEAPSFKKYILSSTTMIKDTYEQRDAAAVKPDEAFLCEQYTTTCLQNINVSHGRAASEHAVGALRCLPKFRYVEHFTLNFTAVDLPRYSRYTAPT